MEYTEAQRMKKKIYIYNAANKVLVVKLKKNGRQMLLYLTPSNPFPKKKNTMDQKKKKGTRIN